MSGTETIPALLDHAERALAKREYRAAHSACLAALQQDPQTPDAFFLLGVLTADHNNHAKAVALYDRALAIEPRDARSLAWKARSLIALSRRAEALDALEAAIACGPQDAQTCDTIGVGLSRAGRHDLAVPHYRAATEAAPNNAEYWYNLAAAQQFIGALDEARASYRTTLSLAPQHVKAWSSLTQITRQTLDANDIGTLQALFEALPSADADARLHIGHALAKAHEDIHQPAEAMGWLARAKERKRQTLGHSPDADRAVFDAAMRSLRTTFEAGPADPSPIFIIGLPRTGTTLVDRIMSSHPDVTSAGELSDFAIALKKAAGTASPYVLEPDTLDKAGALGDLRCVGDAYIASARRVVGAAPRFVDKMPLNFFYAHLIHAALPESRIICLRRHPADSVLSNYRQLFATRFSYYNYTYSLEWAAHYYVMFSELMAALRDVLPPSRFLEIAYEDLIEDLEGQARRLLAFCDLDWHPACLEFHTNTAPVATASSSQVRQPLYKTSVGRWRRYAPHMAPALDILQRGGVLETGESPAP